MDLCDVNGSCASRSRSSGLIAGRSSSSTSLAWLTDCERSPNTIEAHAHDLRSFWTFLDERGLSWDQVGVMELAEFAAWARRPAANVVVLADEAARLSPRTVNRMLTD